MKINSIAIVLFKIMKMYERDKIKSKLLVTITLF